MDTRQYEDDLLDVGGLVHERAQGVILESEFSKRVFQDSTEYVAVNRVVENTFPKERLRMNSKKQKDNLENPNKCQ